MQRNYRGFRVGATMKPKLLLPCALVMISASASAADLAVSRSEMPVPGSSWTGFHVGVNAGAARDGLRGGITPDGTSFALAGLPNSDLRFLTSSIERKDTG